jgi:hypothetical protein
MSVSTAWPIVLLVWGLAACSPELDWREVKADGAALTALFPCRPEHRTRTVALAGAVARMEMVSCAAAGSTFAVSYADLPEPAAVGNALESLRSLAVVNLGAATPASLPFAVRGMTPNPRAARLRVDGRLPDGSAVQEHAVFFARGLRVYQASVIGAAPSSEAVESFIVGLRLPA